MVQAKTITPRELHKLQKSGQAVDLVDVRTPGEYRSGHAEGARLVPLSELSPEKVLAGHSDHAPIYVICQSGGRSRSACRQLEAAGLADVVNVEGGTSAWERAGLPMVRSGAGGGGTGGGLTPNLRRLGLLLVLLGAVLGWLVNPWFSLVALGAWIGMILLGRGACPLETCAIPTQPK